MPSSASSSTQSFPWRPLAMGVGVVVVALIAILLVSGDDDGDAPAPDGSAREVTSGELREEAARLGQPIYWAGEQDDAELELTITSEGHADVRYLTGDAEPGDPSDEFLTIATYQVPDAYSGLQAYAKQAGSRSEKIPEGGIAVANASRPESVYLAFPGAAFQIEVYDPDPDRAFELATSGSVVPA